MTRKLIALVLAGAVLSGFVSAAVAVSSKSADPSENANTAPPPSDPPQWPMKVETFLKGDFLERGDVVLTRRDWDLTSYIIRAATNSPFSHAALVFAKANQEPGITQNFVIEAGTGGVDITNLSDYVASKNGYVAIKRFPRSWFDMAMKARVRGVLLDKIKGKYDFWAIGRIAQALWFGVQNSLQHETATESRHEKTIRKYKANNWTPPNDFICSGLVQMGFVETTIEYIKNGALPPSALSDVVFLKSAEKWLPDSAGWGQLGKYGSDVASYFARQNLDSLRSVTPEDLASSEKLDWQYLIRDGMVYKVASYDDVKEKLK